MFDEDQNLYRKILILFKFALFCTHNSYRDACIEMYKFMCLTFLTYIYSFEYMCLTILLTCRRMRMNMF